MFTLYLIVIILSILYLWTKYAFNYWERKGFPYVKPSFPFGNIAEAWHGRKSIGKELYDLHKSSEKPVEGVYFLFRPALIVRDVKLVKNILTTDFSSFHDRGIFHAQNDPVAANMFTKPGQEWKNLRGKLTPTFTSGKLRAMMPAILQIADNLKRKLSTTAQNSEIIDIKDLTIRFGMDVIGTVGFGLDVNSIDDPDHSFRQIEKHSFSSSATINRLRVLGSLLCPKLLELLRMSSITKKFRDYMVDIVKDTFEHREKNNVVRKDFIQLLMEMRKLGDSNSTGDKKSSLEALSIEQCAAQVALFYVAGFDTTASAIAFTIYELSRRKDLQKRLQDEIDTVLTKYDNVISYESVNDMPFLESCVKESVRKYPTLPFLNRSCTKDYTIDELGLTIPEGTPIVISLLGLMRDPQYFPDPNSFLPDRYSEDKPMYDPDAFIPFGDGPRACIGLRMGKVVVKTALVTILKNYSFECVSDEELILANHALTLAIDGPVNVKIYNRK